MYEYVETQRTTSGVVPQELFTFSYVRQGFLLAWELFNRLGWLANEPSDLSDSFFLTQQEVYMWPWESELTSPFLGFSGISLVTNN